ncbi:unnamed protein product [Phytomonas sp. Hart1]|nr:unnamed protein product [Phytomonas sp. Hart1]|eukprot:CCW69452.1 unnamed protein product [Phytomonas sp. isolate Hart1]
MSGIDYSKWDHIVASESSFGSDISCSSCVEDARYSDLKRDNGVENYSGKPYSENEGNRKPRVVKLSQPSRVMIGPGGVQLSTGSDGYPKAMASPFQSEPSKGAKQNETSDQNQQLCSSNPNDAPFHPPKVPTSCETEEMKKCTGGDNKDAGEEEEENDEEILYRNLTLNGGREGDSHLWAQTDDTLTVSFIVPMDTRGKVVKRLCIYNKEGSHERESAANEEADEEKEKDISKNNEFVSASTIMRTQISISFASPHPLGELRQTFSYRIKTDDELLEGCWELLTLPKRELRVLVVHLFKEAIGAGITFWWDRCFVSDSTSVVDTRALASRRDTPSTAACKSEKAEVFQKVWKEAHEMFQDKMKQRCKK